MGARPRVRVKVRGPEGWPSPPCSTSSPSFTRRSSGACPGLSFSQRAMTWRAAAPVANSPSSRTEKVTSCWSPSCTAGSAGSSSLRCPRPVSSKDTSSSFTWGGMAPTVFHDVPRKAPGPSARHTAEAGASANTGGKPGVPSARAARGSARGPAPRRTRQAPRWPGAASAARGARRVRCPVASGGPPGRASGWGCEASRDQGTVVLATAIPPARAPTATRETARARATPGGRRCERACPPDVSSIGRVPAPVSRWRPMVVPAAP